LRELEDIAKMSIADTFFFCNSLKYIDRVELFTSETTTEAKKLG
jgi:hypothetical protein